MDDLARLARRSIEAFGRPGWQDTMRELMSPGVVYDESGTGRHVEGADGVVEVMEIWLTAFPDIRGEVLRVLSDGESTAVEIAWSGTHDGPLTTAAGEVPPTGASVPTHATMWQRWTGDRIVAMHHDVDVFTLLTLVGVIPAPAVTS